MHLSQCAMIGSQGQRGSILQAKNCLEVFFLNKISISHACMSVLVSISVQLDTVSGGYNGIKKKKEKN